MSASRRRLTLALLLASSCSHQRLPGRDWRHFSALGAEDWYFPHRILPGSWREPGCSLPCRYVTGGSSPISPPSATLKRPCLPPSKDTCICSRATCPLPFSMRLWALWAGCFPCTRRSRSSSRSPLPAAHSAFSSVCACLRSQTHRPKCPQPPPPRLHLTYPSLALARCQLLL